MGEQFPKVNDDAFNHGWGHIAAQALKTLPENVESQARTVAIYSSEKIAELEQENAELRLALEASTGHLETLSKGFPNLRIAERAKKNRALLQKGKE